ncbi:PEP-CTERM sorting domain-containing protein [Emcibacter nanhaiensis]|uniref:PEP-CTERM sorting domain-containing protein n=1 Tax=Emcibacter nanhaiensis TaxID=1505037 RepID=A0A501PMZ2_9PROT|nr:PEP-CTERM sorting domain-containing protein [Emcibacter nanhaiensis]TPD61528.1 PEP-CTERM sorting domain-containing protein [Emcibacter nanhaiensis]
MKILKTFGIAAGLSMAAMSTAQAVDYDIADNLGNHQYSYIGAGSNQDHIGGGDYDVYGMTVDRADNGMMTVRIYTEFVDHVGQYDFGDLFMSVQSGGDSAAWKPYGSAPYYQDEFNNNGEDTTWEYAYNINNGSNDPQFGQLVSINSPMDSDSYQFGTVRYTGGSANEHVYALDESAHRECAPGQGCQWVKDHYTTIGGFGTVDKNTSQDYLEFAFDVSGTSLATASQIAFHWTMSCANDIIEGMVEFRPPQVSEPAIFGLLLAGLGGIAYRRRKARA